MKKYKSFFILLITLTLGLFVACNGISTLSYTVGVSDSGEYPHVSQDSAYILNSRAELETLCASIFFKDGPFAPEYRETHYLRNLAEEYDDSYFASKALIVYIFAHNSGGWLTNLNDLTKDGDTLTLDVEHLRPIGDATQAIIPWTYILEVNKSDTDDATKIVINSQEGVNVFE